MTVRFEAQNYNAWTEAGPERVLREAEARLRKGGWDDVRPALSVTVRSVCFFAHWREMPRFMLALFSVSAWIMRAFMSGGMSQDHDAAIQWYNNAIQVLERGQKLWHDVHSDDRGAIFKDTFVRGIRVLLLDEFMKVLIFIHD